MDTVVGSESCTISDLVKVLEDCPNNSLLYKKFTEVARKLEVDETDIEELHSDYKLLNKITRNDLLVRLFGIWASAQQENATLAKLATALGDTGLNNIKVFLEKSELVKRLTQTTPSGEVVRPLTDEDLDKLKEHLRQNKPKLMELTFLDDLIIAELVKAEMLGPGEVAALNEETNKLTKNRIFYDILETRLGKYYTVAKVMESKNQKDVANLLNSVQL